MSVRPIHSLGKAASAIVCGFLLAGSLPALAQVTADPPGASIQISPLPQHLSAVDLSHDGRTELVSVHDGKICLLFGGQCTPLEIPGKSTLWTVASIGPKGPEELLLLVDGKVLYSVEFAKGALSLSEPLVSGLDGTPPLGLHASSFVRDLDDNGWPDLVVPRGDKVLIWHGTADGFQRGPEVAGMASLILRTQGRNDGLLGAYQRSYTVPLPDTADVSGDGRPDLLVRHGDQVRQYLATDQGFPAKPDIEIELDQFRKDFDQQSLDLGNLTKLLSYIVIDEWADLNNDGALDLLVLSNGKVRIFLGDRGGVNMLRKMRPVKLDGNIFYAKVAHIDDDDVPDLVLVGVEDLGIAELAFSLITSFKLKFYFNVFRGRGDGSFLPRVYRKKTVVLEGGRLLSVIKDNRQQISQMREAVVRLLDSDGDGLRNDLCMLTVDGKFGVWRNVIDDQSPLGSVSENFLRKAFAEKGTLQVDVTTLTEWVLGRTSALISLTRDAPPDWQIDLPGGWKGPHNLVARDFDGDGRDEILVLRRRIPEVEAGQPSLPAELTGWILDPPQ
jgi:hypothetical protein